MMEIQKTTGIVGRAQRQTFIVSDPVKELEDLTHILTNLRYWTVKWETEHGAVNKERKKHWEARADDWMEKHRKA
jgi:hypothetical protein